MQLSSDRAPRRLRRRWLFLFQGVIAVMIAVIARPLWLPLFQPGPWKVVYNGYGNVSIATDLVRLSPKAPASAASADTHAALVVSRERYGDLDLSADVRTMRQLRPDVPNPWEVGWVLWHETDPQHFYAVTLKPNGWEFSKQVPGAPGNQQFIASGDVPRFAVGQWHNVTVAQRGGVITVAADGQILTHYTDSEPYTDGSIGLYTEDAVAIFRDISISTPER